MNHNFWRKGAMLGAAAFISHMMFTSATFSPGALAQPDLNNAPKGDNPPPRERGNRNNPRNNRENALTGPEQNLRRLMTQAGIGEGATQDAILEYVRNDLQARRPLREQGMKLIQALRAGAVTNDQMATLVADYRAAQQAEKTRREQAEAELDAKINYSKNPRLEAMLLLAGVIGDGGGLMLPPGLGGRGAGQGGGRGGGQGQGGGQPLTAEEREQRRRRTLERFDANKDGKLDDQEEAAMRQQRQQEGQQGGPPPGEQPREGQPPTPEEREQRRRRMLERFDTNKDGKLDAQEEAAMRQQRQQQRERREGNNPPPAMPPGEA